MQSPIHEGYEYQDYFTVSIILQLMLHQTDSELIIDRKDFSGDKFDDLKVKTSNSTTEFQIKYSDDKSSHKLTKDDLAMVMDTILRYAIFLLLGKGEKNLNMIHR